jgi:hypothetical protein
MMTVTSETIPRDEVSFHPHSFADADGRLFCWRGQLYRGISPGQSPFFLRLFQDGTIQSLVEKGLLVDSRLTPFLIDGFDLVVRHKTVPFVAYPQEWCAAMLKDAVLLLLDLLIELAGKNLTLKDAHPWNIIFADCKPVFVDLTSIVPMQGDGEWQAYEEFCNYCYYPLILMTLGHDRIARAMMTEYGGIQRRELVSLAQNSRPSRFLLSKLMNRLLTPVKSLIHKKDSGANAPQNFFYQLRKNVERLGLPTDRDKGRTNSNRGIESEQQACLSHILSALRPASVLDVNASQSWVSYLAAESTCQVISLGTDTNAMTEIYYDARKNGLPILPLIMNFAKPTPSIGYSNHYLTAATDRLQCEMVLALSLVHRAVHDYFLSFQLIAEGLALFSRRWVVVEFNQPRGQFSGNEPGGSFSWYSLDNFREALLNRFYKVDIISEDGEGSVLLLCEK